MGSKKVEFAASFFNWTSSEILSTSPPNNRAFHQRASALPAVRAKAGPTLLSRVSGAAGLPCSRSTPSSSLALSHPPKPVALLRSSLSGCRRRRRLEEPLWERCTRRATSPCSRPDLASTGVGATSPDRVSEVKGGRLGWWFRERSREKDERATGRGWGCGGEVWRSPLGGGQAAPPRRSPTSRRAACRGEDLLRWNSVNETEPRSGGHPALPLLSLLVWPPPFWVRRRGHLSFPPLSSLSVFCPSASEN